MIFRSLACTLLLAASSVAVPASAPAQMTGDMMQAKPGEKLPSPPATAHTAVGAVKIRINYNTPSMRNRKIMGGLVPYGQVWRTGANPATTIITDGDLKFGTLLVPAGTHTLFTLPGEKDWLLILNKQTGQWGLEYHQDQDLGRVPMQSKPVDSPQEVMSITFEHTTPTSTELHVRWETTDRYVTITK